jgi:hypothetical protein
MKIIRTLLAGFLIFLSMLVVVFLPLSYSQYRKGEELFSQSERAVIERCQNLIMAFIRIAQENATREDQAARGNVTLSSTMAYLAEKSRSSAYQVQVQEAKLLDRDHKVLAHSDFIQVASDSKSEFNESFNNSLLELTQLNPVGTPRRLQQLEARSMRVALVKKLFGKYLTTKFLFGGVVRTPDDNYARGTVHMLVEVRGLASMAQDYATQAIYAFAIAFALVCGASLILTVVLFILMPGRRRQPESQIHHAGALEQEADGDEQEDEEEDEDEGFLEPDFTIPERHANPAILDAIPLSSTRR